MGAILNAVAAAARRLAVVAALVIAGCGQEREPTPPPCFDEEAVLSTLRQGPPVVLEGGTRLSHCVSAARTDGDLQSLGLLFMRVADVLRVQASTDPDAAFALGYLTGAVTRGSASSSGSIATQLARRIEQVAVLDADAGAGAAVALARGRQAGAREG